MMKKTLLTAMIVASTSAMAYEPNMFGGIEYDYYEGQGDQDGITTNGMAITLGTNLLKYTAIDMRTEFDAENDSNNTANQIEGGLTQSVPFKYGFSGYGRVALGQQWVPGQDFTYYSIEPGVKYAATDRFGLKLAYRFQDSTRENVDFRSNTLRLGAEYALNDVSSVSVGFDKSYDQVEYNSFNLAYNFHF